MSYKVGKPILSVVIPCYNSEIYIGKCLASILGQDFRDIEVICVDDGSTDNTKTVLADIGKEDDRLIIIENQHKGIVGAKKDGIKICKGKYVVFIDSDDWLNEGYFTDSISILEKYDVDAVYYGYFLVKGNNLSVCLPDLCEKIYYHEDICQNLYDTTSSRKLFNWAQWPYVYKTEIVRDIVLKIDDEIEIYEDLNVTWKYLISASKIYVCHRAYYSYRVHSDSTGRKQNMKSIIFANKVYLDLMKWIEERKENIVIDGALHRQLKYMMFDTVQSNTCFSKERQEFYMFPYEKIPKGANIVLYGAGAVGKSYYRQINVNGFCNIVLWCDICFEQISNGKYIIFSPDEIVNIEFDYILICNMHINIANQIKEDLIAKYNLDGDKIVTYRPQKLSIFSDLE